MASELIETTLYNDKYAIVHNPNARGSQPRYVVTIKGVKTKPQGVTTIIGATLSKDLMQWAVDCGMDVLRDRLSNNGAVLQEDIDEAAEEYIKRRNAGASTGTEAHAYVEKFLKGETFSLLTATNEARNAYGAFKKWFAKAKPEIVGVEQVIYSKSLEFAGTYDALLAVDGKQYLCDLKTTNTSRKAPAGVYAENFIQLGAYAFAHEEQRQYEEANGGSKLKPLDDLMVISAKKDGKLDIVTASEFGLTVSDCAKLFLQVHSLHKFLKETTKALGGR